MAHTSKTCVKNLIPIILSDSFADAVYKITQMPLQQRVHIQARINDSSQNGYAGTQMPLLQNVHIRACISVLSAYAYASTQRPLLLIFHIRACISVLSRNAYAHVEDNSSNLSYTSLPKPFKFADKPKTLRGACAKRFGRRLTTRGQRGHSSLR